MFVFPSILHAPIIYLNNKCVCIYRDYNTICVHCQTQRLNSCNTGQAVLAIIQGPAGRNGSTGRQFRQSIERATRIVARILLIVLCIIYIYIYQQYPSNARSVCAHRTKKREAPAERQRPNGSVLLAAHARPGTSAHVTSD